ncbi:MAG: hypothetical protein L0Y72_21585 [Gemmataceae bacterium]|nr:hypothetical protein [Gemmataceae bacterium]MCI0741635.1 hypothetical protein [Gemmataceae bacterium]
MTPARAELIQNLKEQLRRLERQERRADGAAVSTGLAELDRLLPEGGLEPGTLLEWLSAGEGSGAATLALVLAARVQERGAVVIVDERREFFPPAAAALGIALSRTVVVQPAKPRDALWALEQALRSQAVGVAMAWTEKLNDRAFRRLQLAAEAGGSLGFLLRLAACRATPSWAAARFLVQAVPLVGQTFLSASAGKNARPATSSSSRPLGEGRDPSPGRRLRIELLHRRGGQSGGAVELELCDEAGVVHLVSRVADPASARRAARA